ncbi:helix-turn-helix domain-containing protein [Spirosoma jeollabukense]
MLVKEMFCFSAYDTHFLSSYFPGIKLIISLENSFSGVVDGQYLQNVTSLIINRNITHSLEVADAGVLIYYVDYHSVLEPALLVRLNNRPWLVVEPTASGMPNVIDQLQASLFPKSSLPIRPAGNWQLEPIFRYMNTHIREAITLADLAPLMYLSTERTRHVFIEQVGMPFSQYLIWMRLKLVIKAAIEEPQSLGELATYYGFVDPSHFQRLFKRTFGMNPNQLLKQSWQSLRMIR